MFDFVRSIQENIIFIIGFGFEISAFKIRILDVIFLFMLPGH